MGQLYWKFFLFFLLSQLATSLTVGVVLKVIHQHAPSHRCDSPLPVAQAGDRGTPGAMPAQLAPRPVSLPPDFVLHPFLLSIATGTIMSTLFAGLLAGYFARPITILREAFFNLAAGRLRSRVGSRLADRKDELAGLGETFDLMANRLEILVESQKRLLHDVSHEMRSPLARMHLVAGLMAQQPDRCQELLPRIERECERMDTLVGELLTLARLDAGVQTGIGPVNLRELVDTIVEDAAFEAAQKHCDVRVDLPDSLLLQGSPELLSRALENVIRNAVTYSREGTTVRISGRSHRDTLEMRVEDRGPGVPEALLDSIFDPFVRMEEDAAWRGYGLGLAIAKRIVVAHGGGIVAENRPGGGLAVTITLQRDWAVPVLD